jgi:murein DD-endopeptidase MepM/ murein hydrolase activator NlpD
VGSESADTAEPSTVEVPGTAPNAALAAQLRQSQSRFAPPASATPAASPSEGPMPFAAPVVANYPTPATATHVFPVVSGASFSNDWGGPRPGGRSHQGIDLFAKTGTPIVAISDGTLFKVGWNRIGGWRFWLRDRWGNEFYHAHLSAFAPAAKEGAVVKAGTVVGFVGNTGDAKTTPPHLHFEIHPGGGDPIPPFSYVSAWPRL